MLIIFFMTVTLGLTNAIPYETRSKDANINSNKSKPQQYQMIGTGSGYETPVQELNSGQYDPSYGTSVQGFNPGQHNTDVETQVQGLNLGEQSYYDGVKYVNGQSSDVKIPSSRNQVIAENITPNGYTDQNLAVVNPNGYDTINIGNGYQRKNTVYLNNGQNEDELLVATDNKKQYNPDVVGLKHVSGNNQPSVPPCYQNGVLIHGYPCTVESNSAAQYPGASKTYRIGNGYNNENVVTINSRGASSHRTRPVTDTYSNPHRNNAPSNNYYSIGSGYNNQDYLSFLGLA